MLYAYYDQWSAFLQYNNENSLACFLTIAYYAAKKDYLMVREFTSGKGFADIVLMPCHTCNQPAVVLELKYDKSTDTAITQIHKRRYAGTIKAFIGDVVLVGINYDKTTKLHECKIDRMHL